MYTDLRCFIQGNLSVGGSWYPQGSWNQPLVDTEG